MKIERTSAGILIHSALEYDLHWLLRAWGRERPFRRHLLDLARLAPGEAVLDVGCGTGTLTLAARRRNGRSAAVHGVDPSPRMVARARAKARRRRADVGFDVAFAQDLPFRDGFFDLVLCTLVAHELPPADRRACFGEMRRVLKPGGRLLLVDLALRGVTHGGPTPHRHAHGGRTPHRHGHFDVADLKPLLVAEGYNVVAAGPITYPLRRFDPLGYVLAAA